MLSWWGENVNEIPKTEELNGVEYIDSEVPALHEIIILNNTKASMHLLSTEQHLLFYSVS